MEVKAANVDLAPAVLDYAKECHQSGIEMYRAATNDPVVYLENLVDRSKADSSQLPEGWLPSTTYYCLEDGVILGAIRVRNGTNDWVENVIGHIGYETRPSARGKGVAKRLLSWVVNNAIDERVIVTCNVENLPSRKVIEACGGEYLGEHVDEGEGHVYRYCFYPI